METVTLLQLTCVVFLLLLFLGDLFLLFTGTSRIQHGVAGDAETLATRASEGALSDAHGQLRALGYTPLGVYWESVPGHSVFERNVYGSVAHRSFAVVFQFLDAELPRTSLLTAFADGGVIVTQNYEGGIEANGDNYWSGSPEVPAPADEDEAEEQPRQPVMGVIEEHDRRVHEWSANGRTPLACATMDDFLKSQEVYHRNPSLQRSFRPLILNGLLTRLAMLAALPTIVLLWTGPWHKLPWIVLLGECVILHLYTRSDRLASTSE